MVAATERGACSNNSQGRRTTRESESSPLTRATVQPPPGRHVGAIGDDQISATATASANHELIQISVICYDANNVAASTLIKHGPNKSARAVCNGGRQK